MRFRSYFSHYFGYIGLLMSMLGMLLIYAYTGNLKLYIHPRYILFSSIIIASTLLLLVVHYIHAKPSRISRSIMWSQLFLLITLILPPVSLSSFTANSRIDSGSSSLPDAPSSYTAFTTDLRYLELQDWARILQTNPSADQVVGKLASVDGFLLKKDTSFYIGRFKITCCAVDASPLTVPVYGDFNQFEENTWLSVEGTFTKSTDASSFVIQASNILEIDEPKDPYVY